MITVEIYQNEEDHLLTMGFPTMIRVGEQISILKDEYYIYYTVKKIWYRVQDERKKCVPCAEVVLDD